MGRSGLFTLIRRALVAIGAGVAVAAAIRVCEEAVARHPKKEAGGSFEATTFADVAHRGVRGGSNRYTDRRSNFWPAVERPTSKYATPVENARDNSSTPSAGHRNSATATTLIPRSDLAVVATPAAGQANLARRAVHHGVPVVTTSNHLSEVRRLLALHQEALHNRVPVVVGATFMPGFTCLIARHGASEFDQVDEIHVAKVGTGGPSCARQTPSSPVVGGTGLARRALDLPCSRVRSGTRILPGSHRGTRLLPGSIARCVAAGPRIPRSATSDRPNGRNPQRSFDFAAADAAPTTRRRRTRSSACGTTRQSWHRTSGERVRCRGASGFRSGCSSSQHQPRCAQRRFSLPARTAWQRQPIRCRC